MWEEKAKPQSSSLARGLCESPRKPPGVQGSCRKATPSQGAELMLTSGEGECETRVCDTDGEPQCHVAEPTGDVCLARLHARPQPLSMETLQGARDGLERCGELGGELGSCLDLALERFCREPRCVQENARLLIRWDGGELEFITGQGQCEISVSSSAGEPQYHITEKTWDMFVAWMNSHPEPLSIKNLERVRSTLESWGVLGEALSGCFGEAISQFSREPPCVQENTRMRIRWDGWSLEFLSGEGECEISVCYRDGRPQYDIGELPMHMYLARLRTHPDPLSADTLRKVWNRLRNWRGKTDILRTCVSHAWARFQQEPRCVQENARLLIQWGGGELEFISSQGQCEILVLHTELRPQYHITELGGDRPVTWSHTSPEPLSVADLARVWDRLGRWGALGEELSGCFGEAISQFSREPPCVQRNARMGIQWDRGSMEFLSGDGECEISVRYKDGRPQYDIGKLPMRMYLARLRTRPEPLSADTLWSVRDKLGSCMGDRDDLRACFHCAWEGFRQEPRCVQENARLLIRWSGEELEFTSGKGECEITVRYEDGKPQYCVVKIPVPVYLARLHTRRLSLSADTLRRVWSELGSCHGDTDALRACFLCAWQGFRQEPRCVQENARLLIRWDGGNLQFLSREGECEISVCCRDGTPQYEVGEFPVHMYLARLRARPEPLSVDTLWRVRDKLGSCMGDRDDLRACFHCAWQGFCQEPRCVQENARLLIQWGGEELEFVSGPGQCEISVLNADGRHQYHITELGGDRPVTWSHSSPEPLSVADLARVRDRLERWGALGEELSGCFGEAISQFSREPPWVQGNARMGIRWDGGSLQFLSGEGQCEISVSYRDGKAQYCVVKIPVPVYLAQLRARRLSLSADTLRRVLSELGSCHGDTDALRTCFDRAWQGFCQEPRCVQENARLLIRWSGEKLEFVSGRGENLITVCEGEEGRIQYMVQVSGGWPWIARLLMNYKVSGRD